VGARTELTMGWSLKGVFRGSLLGLNTGLSYNRSTRCKHSKELKVKVLVWVRKWGQRWKKSF